MNDRFKFRVWDLSAEMYVPRSQFILLSDGTLIQEIGGEEIIWESTQPEFCTGFKDKNGKLIYENDIVYDKFDDCYKLIYWDDEGYWSLKWEDICGEPVKDGSDFELYGNIHENPELLGESK